MSKKQFIIKAFENLDAESLNDLLQDGRSYQEVPKATFILKLKELFRELRLNEELTFDFKAYPGQCNGCSRGAKGYSFINSQNYCYAHIVFEETAEEFTDIYSCSDFCSLQPEPENDALGFSFDDDEKTGYMLTFDELIEKDFCLRGIAEIQQQLKDHTVLSGDFMLQWQNKYGKHEFTLDIFERKSFSFERELSGYRGSISSALSYIHLNSLAQVYLQLYRHDSFTDLEGKMMWLLSCQEEIPDVKLQFLAKINEEEQYVTFHKINISLSLLHEYFQLQELFKAYSYILPYSLLTSMPHDWKSSADDENSANRDEDDFFQ